MDAQTPHPFTPRHAAWSAFFLLVLSWLFVSGTFLFTLLYQRLPLLLPVQQVFVRSVLGQLTLRGENTLGAWYSSMLLLLAAAAAAACFAVDRARTRAGAAAWILLSVLFIGFSLDELASMRERLWALNVVAAIAGKSPGPFATLALPLAAVAVLVAAARWPRRAEQRPALFLLVLGAALFLWTSVMLLPAVAGPLASSPLAGSALLNLLQDGPRLLGTTCFVAALALYAARAANRPSSAPSALVTPDPEAPFTLSRTRWLAGLVLLGIVITAGAAAGAATSTAHRAHSPDALWAATNFHAALAARDADLVAALATEDVVLRVVPRPPEQPGAYYGKGALWNWVAQLRARGQTFTFGAPRPDGTTVAWRGALTQPDWARAGIAPVPVSSVVSARAGKVASYTVDFAAPPAAGLGPAENWLPSALALMVAGLSVVALWSRRTNSWLGTLGLITLAVCGILVSAFIGMDGSAYVAGDNNPTARAVLEALRAGVVIGACLLVAARDSAWERLAYTIGAVLVGAALGFGGGLLAPLAAAGLFLFASGVSTAALRILPAPIASDAERAAPELVVSPYSAAA